MVNLYTLFKTRDPENHTLFSGTYPYRPHKRVPPARKVLEVVRCMLHHSRFPHFPSVLHTNLQRWPQDPYFPFSSLALHLSEVWKCEITLLSFLIPSSTLLRCVEVWNSHTFPLVSKPLVILYLVLHFSEVWKCGKV